MGLQVQLHQFSIPEHELEQITVIDTTGAPKRVGFCPTPDGSTPYFVRILTAEQSKEITDEVARLRQERGLTTGTNTSQPPDPDEIRRALKREKAK